MVFTINYGISCKNHGFYDQNTIENHGFYY